MTRYIEPAPGAGKELWTRGIEGEVVMLNLLRFRDVADYAETPELKPDEPISGADAYQRYIEHTTPFIETAGGELIFMGDGGAYFIGPTDERWDLVLLVKHRSLDAFRAFATNAEYLAGIGHRTAALADSRLLPMVRR